MLGILGYTYYHNPITKLNDFLLQDKYEAYADIPIFPYSFFSKVCVEPSNKFVYVDRPFDNWILSFEDTAFHKTLMRWKDIPDEKLWGNDERLSKKAYTETFGAEYSRDVALQKYNQHKEQVHDLIPKEQLLTYKFEYGWEPMCKFLRRELPNVDIPWFNKNQICQQVNVD